MNEPAGHTPVLPTEVLHLLSPGPGETIVDATVGRGGHAELLGNAAGPGSTLIGFDLDLENVAFTAARLAALKPEVSVEIHHASFVCIPQVLRERPATAHAILADLGFSSNQMDDRLRGFSFRDDGPLDMRLDRSRGMPASALIERLSERELSDLIYQLGEDPFARRIARKLVEARGEASIQTTATLARLVREAYGSRARSSRMHPATRTFMALRIAVNDELGALERFLSSIADELDPDRRDEHAVRWIHPGARIGIISFHSLEDRMVKRVFRGLVQSGAATALTRKPVTAGADEIRANPRSRSAKLRVIRAHGG